MSKFSDESDYMSVVQQEFAEQLEQVNLVQSEVGETSKSLSEVCHACGSIILSEVISAVATEGRRDEVSGQTVVFIPISRSDQVWAMRKPEPIEVIETEEQKQARLFALEQKLHEINRRESNADLANFRTGVQKTNSRKL